MKIKDIDKLESIAEEFGFSLCDICLVGGAVFADYDVRENGDLDFVMMSGKKAEVISNNPDKFTYGPNMALNFPEKVQCVNGKYHRVGVADDALFSDEYSYINRDGLRLARIEVNLANIIKRGWSKDKTDLKEIDPGAIPDFDWKLFLSLLEHKYTKSASKQEKAKLTLRHYAKVAIKDPRKIMAFIKRHLTKKPKASYNSASKTEVLWQNEKSDSETRYCAILWGAAVHCHEDISADIAAKYEILHSQDIALSDEQYHGFIRAIYQIDDIDPWKVSLKIKLLTEHESKIRFLQFRIPSPSFRPAQRTGSYLCDNSAALKRELRKKYRDSITNYYKDIIIHIGDNERHNQAILNIVNAYSPSPA